MRSQGKFAWTFVGAVSSVPHVLRSVRWGLLVVVRWVSAAVMVCVTTAPRARVLANAPTGGGGVHVRHLAVDTPTAQWPFVVTVPSVEVARAPVGVYVLRLSVVHLLAQLHASVMRWAGWWEVNVGLRRVSW